MQSPCKPLDAAVLVEQDSAILRHSSNNQLLSGSGKNQHPAEAEGEQELRPSGGVACIANRYKTRLCRRVLEYYATRDDKAKDRARRRAKGEDVSSESDEDADENGEPRIVCPYEHRCMFAHSEAELRTTEQNIADGLITDEAIREHKQRHYREAIEARQREIAKRREEAKKLHKAKKRSRHREKLEAKRELEQQQNGVDVLSNSVLSNSGHSNNNNMICNRPRRNSLDSLGTPNTTHLPLPPHPGHHSAGGGAVSGVTVLNPPTFVAGSNASSPHVLTSPPVPQHANPVRTPGSNGLATPDMPVFFPPTPSQQHIHTAGGAVQPPHMLARNDSLSGMNASLGNASTSSRLAGGNNNFHLNPMELSLTSPTASASASITSPPGVTPANSRPQSLQDPGRIFTPTQRALAQSGQNTPEMPNIITIPRANRRKLTDSERRSGSHTHHPYEDIPVYSWQSSTNEV